MFRNTVFIMFLLGLLVLAGCIAEEVEENETEETEEVSEEPEEEIQDEMQEDEEEEDQAEEDETDEAEEPEEPEEETEEEFETTNKTTAELLDGEMEKFDDMFYDQNPSGTFTIRFSRWTIGNESMEPDQIPIGGGFENAVKFNGEAISSFIGIAFKTYNSSDFSVAYGSVIFRAQDTVLGTYEDYSVDYEPGGGLEGSILDGCNNIGKTNYVSGGKIISVYMFSCSDFE